MAGQKYHIGYLSLITPRRPEVEVQPSSTPVIRDVIPNVGRVRVAGEEVAPNLPNEPMYTVVDNINDGTKSTIREKDIIGKADVY